jgi:hypothetical protein
MQELFLFEQEAINGTDGIISFRNTRLYAHTCAAERLASLRGLNVNSICKAPITLFDSEPS